MICSLGPSATVEVTSQLIKAHRSAADVEEPLSDELKLLVLRAVGAARPLKRDKSSRISMIFNGFQVI